MTSAARAACLAFVLAGMGSPALSQSLPSAQSRSLAPSTGAAARLPNTFDGAAAPSTAGPPVATAPVTAVQVAEATLRNVIEQLRAGRVDPALYTPDLATRLTGRLSTLQPLLVGYGAVQTVEAQGTRDSAAQFLVTFDNAATQWLIGIHEDGRIAALLFREAPPESSEPPVPAPDPAPRPRP